MLFRSCVCVCFCVYPLLSYSTRHRPLVLMSATCGETLPNKHVYVCARVCVCVCSSHPPSLPSPACECVCVCVCLKPYLALGPPMVQRRSHLTENTRQGAIVASATQAVPTGSDETSENKHLHSLTWFNYSG